MKSWGNDHFLNGKIKKCFNLPKHERRQLKTCKICLTYIKFLAFSFDLNSSMNHQHIHQHIYPYIHRLLMKQRSMSSKTQRMLTKIVIRKQTHWRSKQITFCTCIDPGIEAIENALLISKKERLWASKCNLSWHMKNYFVWICIT